MQGCSVTTDRRLLLLLLSTKSFANAALRPVGVANSAANKPTRNASFSMIEAEGTRPCIVLLVRLLLLAMACGAVTLKTSV